MASDENGHFKGVIENGIITDFKWCGNMTEPEKKEIIDLIRMLTGCARKLQEYLQKEEKKVK